MNGVFYLRTEDGDRSSLGLSIVEELYGMPCDADIGLVNDYTLSFEGRFLQ